MNAFTEHVVVLGAGVAGLCVATELVARGIFPKVIDRQLEPGPESCSWWAGGMLAPYCEVESAEEAVLHYGKKAATWWQKHTDVVEHQGSLVLALDRDQADLKRFAKRTQAYDVLDADEITELEPDLSGRFSRGLYYREEAHLSPRNALRALKTKLIQQGVTFINQSADPDMLAKDSLVIDCRGIKAKPDLDGLRGVKGEMLILRCPEVQLTRPVRLLHPRIPLYIVPRGDGVYMLGATMVESSAKKHASVRSVMELLNAAYAINPAFGEAEILEIGVDSRPAFANNLPRIRRQGQIIRANGLYRHGFLLAPTLAKMVVDYLEQGIESEWFDTTNLTTTEETINL
ncbi:thiamine biosynthesis protein thio [Marinomonas ushuaiensis DSM 15871]|uniref:D-amino-acid oxidase n=1 Tax=Marinomonas ushuaiensis DSM 15871 TaxID=1122207 RepID=X7E2X7_9GAMM|nr:glycine oxidase ThiO [Marinomonas ushuaiensis]ETX10307.1 thiamine biosynthesis protein thio [Marinomonas ushuaiensis DSM 15871]